MLDILVSLTFLYLQTLDCTHLILYLAPSTMYGGAVSSNNQHYYQGWDPKLYCRQRPQGKHHKNILI